MFNNISIKTRLIAGIMLLLALLMGAFVNDFYTRQTWYFQKIAKEAALNDSETLAVAALPLIITNDTGGLSDLTRAFMSNKQATKMIITDNIGKVLASSGSERIGAPLEEEAAQRHFESMQSYEIVADDGLSLQIERPVLLNDNCIGRVWLTFDKKFWHDELKRLLQKGALFAIIALVIGAGVTILLAIGLTQRLLNLLHVMRRVTAGARDARAAEDGRDEIGQLACEFNKMLEVLRLKEGQLAKLNIDLEQRAEKRTREAMSARDEASRLSGEFERVNSKLTHMAFHDSLTGLYNRSFFEAEIRRLDVKRQLPLAIIMVDVNSVRMTNELFGLKAGDELLSIAAAIFKGACRQEDIVVRYSDDTFLALLPNCDEKGTAVITGRMDKASDGVTVMHIPLSFGVGVAIKTVVEEDIFLKVVTAEELLQENRMIKKALIRQEVVSGVVKAMGECKPDIAEHGERMAELAERFARYLKWEEDAVEQLTTAAHIHDWGKMAVPDEILNKTEKLNEGDWQHIKRHPDASCKVAGMVGLDGAAARGAREHHETWDGKGYPYGISGEDISEIGRIITILDAFDAMTHKRIYSGTVDLRAALTEIEACAGTQFCPTTAAKFVAFIRSQNNLS